MSLGAIVVDTLGMMLNVIVQRAVLQDRDGARRLLRNTARRFPSIVKIFSDAGYHGPQYDQRRCERWDLGT